MMGVCQAHKPDCLFCDQEALMRGVWQELGEGLLFPLIDLFGFNFFMLSSVHLGVVYFVLKGVLEIPVLWVGQLSCQVEEVTRLLWGSTLGVGSPAFQGKPTARFCT